MEACRLLLRDAEYGNEGPLRRSKEERRKDHTRNRPTVGREGLVGVKSNPSSRLEYPEEDVSLALPRGQHQPE